MNINKVLAFLFVSLLVLSCTKPVKRNTLSGDYLGQSKPKLTPELFAPGLVSTGKNERDLAISPDGNLVYFSVQYNGKFAIVESKRTDGKWSKPEVAVFSGLYTDIEPYINPDGNKMYFVSKRPVESGKENKYEYNMWFMDKTPSGWSEPKTVPGEINGHGSVFYPSITKNGDIYFTRRFEDRSEYIFKSSLIDGKYDKGEKLSEKLNSTKSQFNSFVSPDESFIIIPVWGRKDTKGSSDYYVSFKDSTGNWSDLINLGEEINSRFAEYTPSLSPDGKYFFFQRNSTQEPDQKKPVTLSDINRLFNSPKNGNSDIYWVDVKVIHDLNPYRN